MPKFKWSKCKEFGLNRPGAFNLTTPAGEIRKTGEERADAIGAANRNVSAMSQERRDAIVAKEAAAAR